jgi:amino acid adenylation domain-containing protein
MHRHGSESFHLRACLRVRGVDSAQVVPALEVQFSQEPALRQRWQPHPASDMPLLRDLSCEDAVRASVRVESADRHGCVLHLELPAYCADEASVLLLADRLVRQLTGTPPACEDTPSFALVADWERSLAEDEEAAVSRGVWRERLAELAAARASWPGAASPGPSWRSEQVRADLPDDLHGWLRSFDRDGLPGAALLAAWGIVAARRMGVALPLGVLLDGRGEEALADVVGPMARVVPFPLPWRPERPLSSAVELVRATLFDSRARQDCFDWGAEQAPPGEVRAFAPVCFARRAIGSHASEAGVAIELLSLNCIEDTFLYRLVDEGGRLALDFDAALRDAEDARRMLGGLIAFLEAARQAPSTPVHQLPVIGPQEAAALLQAARGQALPAAEPLVATLLVTARRHPDRIAVESDGYVAVTYGHLEAWSARLAAAMLEVGAGVERVVAICLPPSAALAAAMLAAMRSGSAFTLLEPTHPPARLAALLQRLRPVAIVVDPSIDPVLAAAIEGADLRRLSPQAGIATAKLPQQPPVCPDALAYALFTSGSTGQPRCVGVPRAALDRQIQWFVHRFELVPGARVLARSSPAFDAALWEWLAPLSAGATVVAAAGAGLDQPVGPAIARGAATHAQFVPNLLDLLAQHEPQALRGLQTVFVGGEVLCRETAARVAAQAGLVNLYGPTECCIQVAAWQGDPGAGPGPVPVGTPVTGTELIVAATPTEIAATGAVGELMIGGACLGRGYLDDARATAQAFVPHPWAQGGRRLFLTGDVVRDGGAEGLIVFGRRDDQVKVRGARVELAEVAAVLRSVPGVVDCAVLVDHAPGQGGRLIAVYVVHPDELQSLEHGLAAEAARLLPSYMVPARLLAVPRLPRLASGKPDMAELRRLAGQRSYEAPATATERLVADVWREVLGVPRVGRHDRFFDLGGHSILMLRTLSRLRAALGRDVALQRLHEAPDVATLARLIDADADASCTERPDD